MGFFMLILCMNEGNHDTAFYPVLERYLNLVYKHSFGVHSIQFFIDVLYTKCLHKSYRKQEWVQV